MNKQQNKGIKSLRAMLGKPDCKAVRNIYLNIRLRAFIEYFKRLTNRGEYYDEVFSNIVKVTAEIFTEANEKQLRESLTLRDVLFASEQLLRGGAESAGKTLFLIDKALMEPLAVCGNIQNKIPAARLSLFSASKEFRH